VIATLAGVDREPLPTAWQPPLINSRPVHLKRDMFSFSLREPNQLKPPTPFTKRASSASGKCTPSPGRSIAARGIAPIGFPVAGSRYPVHTDRGSRSILNPIAVTQRATNIACRSAAASQRLKTPGAGNAPNESACVPAGANQTAIKTLR
jgi:hypothetical protein